jgi:Na+-transporting NADH:ubiquinone oxidoreductase subunit F
VLEIIIPTVVATAITLVLAILVLSARQWLIPSESVEIRVNGRKSVTARTGQKLLLALETQGVYLPAACGGRGTCGQCRVTVGAGVRQLLPTEAAHISRGEAARGVRLACMLTVRRDLAITVPEDLLDARRFRCRVESSRSLTPFLKELVFRLPDNEEMKFEAGDYVLLEAPPHKVRFDQLEIPPEYRAEWTKHRLLDLRSETLESVTRAYSLANPPQDCTHIVLVVRIAVPPGHARPDAPPGKASSYIFSLRPGDEVAISGPFGEFHAQPSSKEMVLIAGGAGIAPIRSIILDQLARGTDRKLSLWYGVRSPVELCFDAEFRTLAKRHENFEYHAAISDVGTLGDWQGPTGLIHTVVYERYLKQHAAPEDVEYYLCGPPLMSAAVTQMLDSLGVDGASIWLDDFGA